MSILRTYSLYNQHAVALLGQLIRMGRVEAKLRAKDVAERAGISRSLLQRIEKGDPTCSIGAVFEVASIVGVKLFDADDVALKHYLHEASDKLALLPKAVHRKIKDVDDDF